MDPTQLSVWEARGGPNAGLLHHRSHGQLHQAAQPPGMVPLTNDAVIFGSSLLHGYELRYILFCDSFQVPSCFYNEFNLI
jgi:hypothetical protein